MPVYVVEDSYTSTTKLWLSPWTNEQKTGPEKRVFFEKRRFSGFEFFSALYYLAVRTGMHASGVGQGWGGR